MCVVTCALSTSCWPALICRHIPPPTHAPSFSHTPRQPPLPLPSASHRHRSPHFPTTLPHPAAHLHPMTLASEYLGDGEGGREGSGREGLEEALVRLERVSQRLVVEQQVVTSACMRTAPLRAHTHTHDTHTPGEGGRCCQPCELRLPSVPGFRASSRLICNLSFCHPFHSRAAICCD